MPAVHFEHAYVWYVHIDYKGKEEARIARIISYANNRIMNVLTKIGVSFQPTLIQALASRAS